MSAVRVYLDHNATAPLRPEARAAMVGALDVVGNPSSVHWDGRQARKIVEDAREQVAALVGAAPADVVFTSGATEANNWVLAQNWRTVILPKIEHDSVLAPARASGARLVELAADDAGLSDVSAIADHVLRSDLSLDGTLVAMQLANNETGVVQPLAEVADFCRVHGLAIHSDAVQAAGRVAIDFAELGVDSLSLSSHKIGGPTGVGALIMGDRCEISPLIAGGGQERRRRSGTENVVGIAGFGAAAECAAREVTTMGRLGAMRDRLEQGLCALTPEAVVIAGDSARLANTTCIGLPGQSAETLLIKLDLAGISISSGAACSSGKVGASHVLAAMGLAPDVARGAIRISLGWTTSENDIDAFLKVWSEVVGERERAVA